MESRYDTKAWATATILGRRVFNYNFRLTAADISGWDLLKLVPMRKDAQMVETAYIIQPKEASPEQLIRVSTTELTSWRAAQEQLTQLLDHNMRPGLPGGVAELGDVSFVAREQQSDIPVAAQFTRGNMAISLSSVGAVPVNVLPQATAVDRLLSLPVAMLPHLARTSKRKKPQTIVPRGKEGSTLVRDLAKAAGSAWMKVMVPDGELVCKGKALLYVSGKRTKQSLQIQLIER